MAKQIVAPEEKLVFCPGCGSRMNRYCSSYGPFWSCPVCKTTVDVARDPRELDYTQDLGWIFQEGV